MNGFLSGFADELTKTASPASTLKKVWRKLGPETRNALGWMGGLSALSYGINPDQGVGRAALSGIGITGGDILATKALRRVGVKDRLGLLMGGMAGGHVGANALHSLANRAKGYSSEKRAAVNKTHLTPGSSNVKGFSYDPKTQQLSVTFNGGSTYRYSGVPATTFRSLRRNKSAGKTVNKLVKAKGYEYEKVAMTLIELALLGIPVGGAIGAATAPKGQRLKRGLIGAGLAPLSVTGALLGAHELTGIPPGVRRAAMRVAPVLPIASGLLAGRVGHRKVAKQKSYKCKFCKEQATKGILWAEGKAIVPCCEKHLAKGKASLDHPSEIDGIRDLTKTATGDLVKSPENRAAFLAKKRKKARQK